MKLILTSRAYQLSSTTLPENETDRRFYSHYYAKRISAEVLLDAISQVTGVPDTFAGYPVGIRATQLPDPGVESHFLKLFGQSDRVTACERNGDVTRSRSCCTSRTARRGRKSRRSGRLAKLMKHSADDAALVEGAFLGDGAASARGGVERSRGCCRARTARVIRDLSTGALNSKEFVFNH
jgi:hypothetical protein